MLRSGPSTRPSAHAARAKSGLLGCQSLHNNLVYATRIILLGSRLPRSSEQNTLPDFLAAFLVLSALRIKCFPGLPGHEPSAEALLSDLFEGSPFSPHFFDAQLYLCRLDTGLSAMGTHGSKQG